MCQGIDDHRCLIYHLCQGLHPGNIHQRILQELQEWCDAEKKRSKDIRYAIMVLCVELCGFREVFRFFQDAIARHKAKMQEIDK